MLMLVVWWIGQNWSFSVPAGVAARIGMGVGDRGGAIGSGRGDVVLGLGRLGGLTAPAAPAAVAAATAGPDAGPEAGTGTEVPWRERLGSKGWEEVVEVEAAVDWLRDGDEGSFGWAWAWRLGSS